MSAWLPDLVASWHDALAPRLAEAVQRFQNSQTPFVREKAAALLESPHTEATRIDTDLARLRADDRFERTYRALQAASEAMRRAGVVVPHNYGGPGWSDVRIQWRETGNLTKAADGILLPQRSRVYRWQGQRPGRKDNEVNGHFGAFVRVRPPMGLVVRTRPVPGLATLPTERLDSFLRVGVAPIVSSMNQIEYEPVDGPEGRRAFRVNLRNPQAMADVAMEAVKEAAEAACDVLVLPELCLTPEGQETLRRALPGITGENGGKPWFVVAGSAYTPGPTGPANRARAFSSLGQELLVHDKLFPYSISSREGDRYGVGDALKLEAREEDLAVRSPRVLEVLECPLGRTALLICEDLANHTALATVIDALEVDWLIVPVMDGVQTEQRWTAKYAARYAEDQGVTTVVATCGALVAAHRRGLVAGGERDPGPLVGLLGRRRGWKSRVTSLGEGTGRIATIDLTD